MCNSYRTVTTAAAPLPALPLLLCVVISSAGALPCLVANVKDFNATETCLALVNCSKIHISPWKVPIASNEGCDKGFYCECSDPLSDVRSARCPFNHVYDPWHQQRLDYNKQACVSREEVQCCDGTVHEPDADGEGACLNIHCNHIAADRIPWKLPSSSETEYCNGYYCVCDTPQGPPRKEQCPIVTHYFVFRSRQILDVISQQCVSEDLDQCSSHYKSQPASVGTRAHSSTTPTEGAETREVDTVSGNMFDDSTGLTTSDATERQSEIPASDQKKEDGASHKTTSTPPTTTKQSEMTLSDAPGNAASTTSATTVSPSPSPRLISTSTSEATPGLIHSTVIDKHTEPHASENPIRPTVLPRSPSNSADILSTSASMSILSILWYFLVNAQFHGMQ